MPKPSDPKKDPKKEEARTNAPATIIVSLPESAKLTVDGAATTSTSSTRVLVSPTLNAGQDYHYDLKAEVVVDGKPVVIAKQITVRAGEETRVQLVSAK